MQYTGTEIVFVSLHVISSFIFIPPSFCSTYYFMNKPSGLKHWSDEDAESSFDKDANEAIVLIDPDFIFMKKFEVNITATPGSPAGAYYGLGEQWLGFNLTRICGANSLCAKTTQKMAKEKGVGQRNSRQQKRAKSE